MLPSISIKSVLAPILISSLVYSKWDPPLMQQRCKTVRWSVLLMLRSKFFEDDKAFLKLLKFPSNKALWIRLSETLYTLIISWAFPSIDSVFPVSPRHFWVDIV